MHPNRYPKIIELIGLRVIHGNPLIDQMNRICSNNREKNLGISGETKNMQGTWKSAPIRHYLRTCERSNKSEEMHGERKAWE